MQPLSVARTAIAERPILLTATVEAGVDLAALEPRWLAVERRSAGSFFQSWAWVGCLAEERFDDPVLIEVKYDGAPVAMALFNRGPRRFPFGRRMWLGESGKPKLDAVFIEHNGVLVVRHMGTDDALRACLCTALSAAIGTRGWLVLSGVDRAHREAAAGVGIFVAASQTRMAPYVDLAAARTEGTPYLSLLSANTRYQLRRSMRRYAEAGAVSVTRATSLDQALDFFQAMGVLHQATWRGRGQPGAFASPEFTRFHHALIERAHAAGGVDMLRIAAGDRVLGYLYNMRHYGRVCAYQSGFDYAGAEGHERPGLTCHHAAIEHYLSAGDETYDFLAGDGRYKTSLSTATAPLHWLRLVDARSAAGLVLRCARAMRSGPARALKARDPAPLG